jgi:hypothetical protein
MHLEGILLHIGINYVISPPPELNKRQYLAFQNALVDVGIEFNRANDTPQEICIEKKAPPLRIRVIAAPDAPIGQLLIVAPHPNRNVSIFCKQTESIVEAFNQTWERDKQILSCDSTIRYLYETSSEHAFKELWEAKLQQPESSLKPFGRPVLGGGLRFVMPPLESEDDPTQIEVKIESYLQDSQKIFIEVGFKWPQPKPPGSPFDPIKRLETVNNYIEKEVKAFIRGE